MAVLVRSALESDSADISRLTSQLGYDAPESEVASRLSRILGRKDQTLLIAEADDRPVGWLHAVTCEFIESEAFVLIAGLVVDTAHRRSGVGRLLLERAEDWARTHGCSVVRLSSTSTRIAAHQFYQHLGYVNVKTQVSFVKSVDPDRQ